VLRRLGEHGDYYKGKIVKVRTISGEIYIASPDAELNHSDTIIESKQGRPHSPRLAAAVARVLAGETAYAVARDMSRDGPRVYEPSIYRAIRERRRREAAQS